MMRSEHSTSRPSDQPPSLLFVHFSFLPVSYYLGKAE